MCRNRGCYHNRDMSKFSQLLRPTIHTILRIYAVYQFCVLLEITKAIPTRFYVAHTNLSLS